ncbi:MAG: ROK family transcriptional regulator [Candidatus Dormibacteraeota bacterium]|nr:ROK family transcriptional regulator [Candidatus Dormibacteraeota bacterium]
MRRPGGGSLQDLRRTNRESALRLLRTHGAMTQAELSRLSGLSRASVFNIVRDLTDEGLARVTTTTRNGRRVTEVTLNPDAGIVVGVDIGNRHVRVAVADLAHQVLAEQRVALPLGHRADEAIGRSVGLVRRLVRQADRDPDQLRAAAIGIPGPILAGAGRLGTPPVLPGWADVEVGAAFSDQLGVRAVVDNDANLGALAESAWGRGRGIRDFAYLKVSTGIGAGLVLNGQLYRGAYGTAGEIGHTTIEEDGAVCRCGNRGCLETMAAAPALLELLRAAYGTLTLEDLLRLSADGDIGCRRVIADAGRHIGVAVANLCNLLNPGLIIVGGELAAAGDLLLNSIRESMARRAMSAAERTADVVTGAFAERTAVLGAVALALQNADASDAQTNVPAVRTSSPKAELAG